VPTFVSFRTCITELAHGEKIAYSITHPAYLMSQELKLALQNNDNNDNNNNNNNNNNRIKIK